ncbi:MAG: patatin-like phospholipase family protein [Betaproteobacteria bacterium]
MNRRDFVRIAAALPLVRAASAQAARSPVALVLGGGGCRGYGHIGVLRVLEREGLQPDLIVGSSAGSLVGALSAAGLNAEAIERLGARMNPNMLRDWVFPGLGMFSGEGIARFVRRHAGNVRIESLPRRFAAVATDLRSGERVILDKGDLGVAVQASSSAPGLLEPVRLGGRLLVDGNIASPVPVETARRLGAKRVIAVDVTFPPGQADLDDPFDALYQGFSILTRKLAIEERAAADLFIEPPIPEHHEMSARVVAAHIAAGERSASAALPRLRRLFDR